MTDFDSNDILNRQNIAERNPFDQRFYEMNRQIGELIDLVLALTQQIFSNQREGNKLNTVTTNANSRSDNQKPEMRKESYCKTSQSVKNNPQFCFLFKDFCKFEKEDLFDDFVLCRSFVKPLHSVKIGRFDQLKQDGIVSSRRHI